MMSIRNESMVNDHSPTATSPASSSFSTPRTAEPHDSALSNDFAGAIGLPTEYINFPTSVAPVQLYALQQLHNQGLLQPQYLLRQFPSPVNVMNSQQHLPFVAGFPTLPAMPTALPTPCNIPSSIATLTGSLDASDELPDPIRRTKRKRADRIGGFSGLQFDGDESDSESLGEKSNCKQPKLASDCSTDGDLSDITSLLSLPQKEAAQRLGISESMLCKRFKECTRRKWPFRFLRKIEKTIASLESQKDIEPLSVEDQERLTELLKQRVECLAPVKIRITKSPTPTTCSRSGLLDSDMMPVDYDSDSDDSDTHHNEADFETEAVENLIGLSRCTSPRSFMPTAGMAC